MTQFEGYFGVTSHWYLLARQRSVGVTERHKCLVIELTWKPLLVRGDPSQYQRKTMLTLTDDTESNPISLTNHQSVLRLYLPTAGQIYREIMLAEKDLTI